MKARITVLLRLLAVVGIFVANYATLRADDCWSCVTFGAGAECKTNQSVGGKWQGCATHSYTSCWVVKGNCAGGSGFEEEEGEFGAEPGDFEG